LRGDVTLITPNVLDERGAPWDGTPIEANGFELTEKGHDMTRKDYNLIALAIKTQVAPHNDTDTVWQVANAISDSLALDNPRFDSFRFMQACGVNQ
jgi:hypothetical protein